MLVLYKQQYTFSVVSVCRSYATEIYDIYYHYCRSMLFLKSDIIVLLYVSFLPHCSYITHLKCCN